MSLNPNSDCTIWRYCSFHEFFALIQKRVMIFRHFPDLDRSDQEEGKVPRRLLEIDPAINDEFIGRFAKHTYVSCWHKAEHEDSLMWRVYAPRGIAIKTRKRKLLGVLELPTLKESVESPRSFRTYDVDYLQEDDFDCYRPDEAKISQILALKRKAFASEKELRIMYLDSRENIPWKKYSDKEKFLLVPIMNFEWIEGIYGDPSLFEWFVDSTSVFLSPLGLKLEKTNRG